MRGLSRFFAGDQMEAGISLVLPIFGVIGVGLFLTGSASAQETYRVRLTASNTAGTDDAEFSLALVDPLSFFGVLAGIDKL